MSRLMGGREPTGEGRVESVIASAAMGWRKWSNGRQFSAEAAAKSLGKYNRLCDNRSDTGPSKPRVAGSNPAGRASFLKNALIVPTAWPPGAKVQGEHSDRSSPQIG